uniref:Sodium:solute symporter family protein n=1 Tax=Candidatus Kentrum sp. LFY TaxID=2126342 RepID=A0A450U6T1_9GAMM|nr:MAG: hypothetical protein BECKLFY1418A_GA0070994_100175 [Candidatus Kentron sp. LFY]
MSTWQNLTAVSEQEKGIRNTLIGGAIKIMVAPGLIGTIFGMSLAHSEGVTDTNILSKVLDVLMSVPTIPGALLLTFILVVFFAATLSTLDGQLLASTKALIFDVFHIRKARNYLLDSDDAPNDPKVFQLSDLAMVLVTMVIGVITYAFHVGTLSLFDMVYIAVIGQTSLVLATIFMLIGKDENYHAMSGITAALFGGCLAVSMNILEIKTILGIDSWLNIAPIAAMVFSIIGIRRGGKQ